MPKANKKTVSVPQKLNTPLIDKDLTSYHPDNMDGGSSIQIKDWEDGFTSFINRIDARKVRARSRIFPEDSN